MIYDVIQEAAVKISLFGDLNMFETGEVLPYVAKRVWITSDGSVPASSKGIVQNLGLVELGHVFEEVIPMIHRSEKDISETTVAGSLDVCYSESEVGQTAFDDLSRVLIAHFAKFDAHRGRFRVQDTVSGLKLSVVS
jgi:hypothetical protein